MSVVTGIAIDRLFKCRNLCRVTIGDCRRRIRAECGPGLLGRVSIECRGIPAFWQMRLVRLRRRLNGRVKVPIGEVVVSP